MTRIAINPNTVSKAYRELEHEGLVAARAGVGTFVTASISKDVLASLGPIRHDLEQWLVRARSRVSTTIPSKRCSERPFGTPPP